MNVMEETHYFKALKHTLDKYGYETHAVKDSDQALECLDAQPNWKNKLARSGSELVSAPTARLPLVQSTIDSHPSMSPNDRPPARFNSGLET